MKKRDTETCSATTPNTNRTLVPLNFDTPIAEQNPTQGKRQAKKKLIRNQDYWTSRFCLMT
jgi:hypothetical protein